MALKRHARTLKLDREGVAQSVSVNTLLDLGLSCQTRQEMPHVALIDLAAVERAKDRRVALSHKTVANVEPPLDERCCASVETHKPPLIALSVLHHDRLADEIERFSLPPQ